MVTPGAHGGVSKAFVWSGTDGSAGRPAEALARVGCGADVPGCPGGSHQLHIDALIALVCARRALPVAAAGRQQAMAVSVLACERVLAAMDGRPAGWLEEQGGSGSAGRAQRRGLHSVHPKWSCDR